MKSPKVMSYPDFNKPFSIHCDFNELGLGVVLYQEQERQQKVICYASINYHQLRKSITLIVKVRISCFEMGSN